MKNPLLDGVLLIPWLHFLLFLTIYCQAGLSFANRFKSRGASLVEQQSYLYSSQNPVPQTLRTPPTTYYYYDPIATPVNVRQRRQRQFVNTDKSSVVVLQNPVQNGRQSINFEQTAKVQIKELPPLIRTRQSPPSRFFAQGMYNFFTYDSLTKKIVDFLKFLQFIMRSMVLFNYTEF